MFTGIFLVIMLEVAEATRVKYGKNNHNLNITYSVGTVTILLFLVFYLIFFLL